MESYLYSAILGVEEKEQSLVFENIQKCDGWIHCGENSKLEISIWFTALTIDSFENIIFKVMP